MTRKIMAAMAAMATIIACNTANTAVAQSIILLTENFDSVVLGQNALEPSGGGPDSPAFISDAWTHTTPSGWTSDNSLVPGIADPAVGVPEWENWCFANKDWWVGVAGDQDRSKFTFGSGTIAIVDPDEWDDFGSPGDVGTFEAYLNTSAIDITGATAGSAVLQFDSSWRDEDSQKAHIDVSYDGGVIFNRVLTWHSNSASSDFHDDESTLYNSRNEQVTVNLNNPQGATSAIVKFGMSDATNDWWWAIDNVEVSHSGGVVMSEDFEGLPLGPGAWEPSGMGGTGPEVYDNAYSHDAPNGWSVDNSNMPTGGMTEWAGWSFTDPEFWVAMAGDQDRSLFTKGQNVVVVADGDEWDDFPHEEGDLDSTLLTPEISLEGIAAGSVQVTFDSSWWDEDFQQAIITASFDGGEAVEFMHWTSVAEDPNFKDEAPNETVTISIDNPEGAQNMVIGFRYIGADDWWWSIDNVEITASADPHLLTPGDANGDGVVNDEDAAMLAANWLSSDADWSMGDFNFDGKVDQEDATLLAANWQSNDPPASVPEPSIALLMLIAAVTAFIFKRPTR